MIKFILRNIFRFIFLVVIQVFVFNNIRFSGYINPYVYILFILLLPFETPKWLLLMSSFMLGFMIDIFSGTMGIHSSATLLMAFFRPYVLKIMAPRDGYESGTLPRLFFFGVRWFVNYTVILVLIHHFTLFYLEVFKFTEFFQTLLRVILSAMFTVFFIIFSQYIIFRR